MLSFREASNESSPWLLRILAVCHTSLKPRQTCKAVGMFKPNQIAPLPFKATNAPSLSPLDSWKLQVSTEDSIYLHAILGPSAWPRVSALG